MAAAMKIKQRYAFGDEALKTHPKKRQNACARGRVNNAQSAKREEKPGVMAVHG